MAGTTGVGFAYAVWLRVDECRFAAWRCPRYPLLDSLQSAGRGISREMVADAVKRLPEACWPPCIPNWWSLPVTLRRLLFARQRSSY